MKKRTTLLGIGITVPLGTISSIAAAGLFLGGSRAEAFTLSGLPADVAQNYEFATAHASLLEHIPCYCGCHSLGHRNLRDCFLRSDGSYEPHASGCGICGMEADDVELMMAAGEGPHSIRLAIDARYSEYGRPTDTR